MVYTRAGLAKARQSYSVGACFSRDRISASGEHTAADALLGMSVTRPEWAG